MGNLNRRTWGLADEATTDEKHRASLYVASIAHDKADATHLLGALGLLPKRLTAEHGMRGYRAGCRCTTCRKANTTRNRRQLRTSVTDCPINTTTEGDQQ